MAILPKYLNLRLRVEGYQTSITLHISEDMYTLIKAKNWGRSFEGFEVFKYKGLYYATVTKKYSYDVSIDDAINKSDCDLERLKTGLKKIRERLTKVCCINILNPKDEEEIAYKLSLVEDIVKNYMLPVDVYIQGKKFCRVSYKDSEHAYILYY